MKLIREAMTRLSRFLSNPWSLASWAGYAIFWFVMEKYNIGWDGFGQIASLLFLIAVQTSQTRDTAALHAKLDEILISMKEADSSFAGIEKEKEVEEIEELVHEVAEEVQEEVSSK